MKLRNLLLLGIAFVLFTQCTQSPEISQWRGPDRNGVYPETNLLDEWPEEGPELAWQFDELGTGYSSAAVTNDFVFIAGTIDTVTYVFKLDHTGNLLWKKRLGPEWGENFVGINSTPLIYGEYGYLLGGLGDLFCFSVTTGDVIWNMNILTEFDGVNNGYGITENLLIDGDKLFLAPGGLDANVIALNKNTGELIWKSSGNGEKTKYCSPALVPIGDKKFYITATDSSIISINTENGELAWKYDAKSGCSNIPIFYDDHIFVMTGDPLGSFKLKLTNEGESVEKVWETLEIKGGMGEAVIINDKVYGSQGRKQLIHCLDWETGNVIDSVKTKFFANIIAADNKIYGYSVTGEVSVQTHDENGFQTTGKFQLEAIDGHPHDFCTEPVIKNGRLYIRYVNNLFVYNIAKSLN